MNVGQQNQTLTWTGFGREAVAGAGVLAVALAVAGVEVGAGWGLELDCAEEGGFPATGPTTRGVALGTGTSGRTNLFS